MFFSSYQNIKISSFDLIDFLKCMADISAVDNLFELCCAYDARWGPFHLMLRAVVPNDGTITVRYSPIKDCEEFIIFKELVELADQNDFRVGSSCWKVSDQKIFFGLKFKL